MRDEDAAKLINEAGARAARERQWRERLAARARRIVERQAREIRTLKAALVAAQREDD